ncbi:DUF6886 family protein [Streptomyces sp. NPDC004031]
MRLCPGEVLHFSEDPTITVFRPHVAATARQPEAYVRAVLIPPAVPARDGLDGPRHHPRRPGPRPRARRGRARASTRTRASSSASCPPSTTSGRR